jgi:dynamin 1-like protein
MDIMPTGKNMVTRTPLDLRLHKLKTQTPDGWAEFGHYEGTEWISEKKIKIKVPMPTKEEVQEIRQYISNKTVQLAGEGMNISDKPIILNIYSPYVPNLSLIDLPGLTMVAQVDRGQPADIRERIEELVVSYIKQPRTIVIAVMQARPDMETDIGLALIKKFDTKGQRTIGVLTKPDLMNYDTHVGEYLTNSISKNLMLTYGYYVVRNRSDKEGSDCDIFKGMEMEKTYFTTHEEYKKEVYRGRVGSNELSANLNKILISAILELLPSVMSEITALEMKLNKKLDKMGAKLPDTKEGKLGILNRYVSDYNHRIVDSIESRGNYLNAGKTIKDIFIEYRNELQTITPFKTNPAYNDEYFKHIISSFEGNHMSFYTPPIQILEACMIDEKLHPIMMLREKSLICVDYICDALIGLVRTVGQEEEFSQYPPLSTYLMTTLIDNVVAPLRAKTKDRVVDMIKDEEAYIWTDSPDFKTTLLDISKSPKFDTPNIQMLLESYFTAIKIHVGHSAPKIIMSGIVREIERGLLSFLFQQIVREECIEYLREDDEIEKQRVYYSDLKNRIDNIKKAFAKNATKK